MPLAIKATIILVITVSAMLISPLTLAAAVWLAGAGILPLAILLAAAIPVVAFWSLTTRRSRPTN